MRPAAPEDLPAIIAYDRPRSGFARAAILADLICPIAGLRPRRAAPSGSLAGFVLGREGIAAGISGPVVAEDEANGAYRC